MRHSMAIKNLSIALEALSRIPGSDPEALSLRIQNLLNGLLVEEEEREPPKLTAEDEIPF